MPDDIVRTATMPDAASNAATGPRLEEGLKRFGVPSFRPKQREICTALVEGRSVLAILPTGAGKSLCYQLPAIVRKGTAIVISPLLALMADQVRGLRDRKIAAATINSLLSDAEREAAFEAASAGKLELLYVAPETAIGHEFRDLLSRMEIALVAIDEAHCVSAWGHDFRPEYRKIAQLREVISKSVPWIALTATADPDTKADIVEQLGLDQALHVQTSFDRPNIRLAAKHRGTDSDAIDEIVRIDALFPKDRYPSRAGIVYCLARKTTVAVAKELQAAGMKALAYHAGMTPAQRKKTLASFTNEPRIVIVATVAFGMGIDRADVRWIVHRDLPKGPEGYSQETGRAGRDGKPAIALLLWGVRDVVMLRKFIKDSNSSLVRARETARLDAMVDIASGVECRRQATLAWFHEIKEPCGTCDVCLGSVEAAVAAFAKSNHVPAAHVAAASRSSAHAGTSNAGTSLPKISTYERLRGARKKHAGRNNLKLWEVANNATLENFARWIDAAEKKRAGLGSSAAAIPAEFAHLKILLEIARF